MECITSWLREVPIAAIVNSALLNIVIHALAHDDSLEAAADCLGAICRETRDVDDNLETITVLLPRIVDLRPRMQKAADDEDTEAFKAMTRLFAEAGESWAVIIAREPIHFRPLVDIILECCARDKERDVIEHTFNFWYELKQYVVLEKYVEARMQLYDVYANLVEVLLKHLQYPESESGNELDLFDGDREQEEKFREFRHQMGDTLKDSCEVLGVADCLTKMLQAIKVWMQKYASQVTATSVPHWQELEAPVFGIRALGRMVNKEESTVLPQLMPLLVQMPNHEKLRFATIMVFGRYTGWTAEHPEFLQPQFNYIVTSFQTDSKEIVRAAAVAIKFFCTECKDLLSDQVVQLQSFYDQILDKLPEASQEEITEGVASVVGVQKPEEIYKLLKMYCDPLVNRLMLKANAASTDDKGNEKGKLAIAGKFSIAIIGKGAASNIIIRSCAASDPVRPIRHTLRSLWARGPGSQVLAGSLPHLVHCFGQFHYLYAHLRADLQMLAAHGHLVPRRHDAPAATTGQQARGRLRSIQAGRLFVGVWGHPSRVLRGPRASGREHTREHLQILREPGDQCLEVHERHPSQPAS